MDTYRRNSFLYGVCVLVGVGLILVSEGATHLGWLSYVGIFLTVFGLTRQWRDYRKRYYPKD